MRKTTLKRQAIKMVGITVRTRNASEMNPTTEKILPTIGRYFKEEYPGKISHRKTPGTTYCAYTDYESDLNGEYTFFVGEEVESFEGILPEFKTLTIPPQSYTKFTHGPGKMPDVCIEAWQKIWKMTPSELGGDRTYRADFEVYDTRSRDPHNTTLDIYIGCSAS